jgi:hypothetical protein
MTTDHKNECPVAAGQNVKSLTKYATHFIAKIRSFASGFCLDRSIDLTFILCCVALLLQAAVMALGRLS